MPRLCRTSLFSLISPVVLCATLLSPAHVEAAPLDSAAPAQATLRFDLPAGPLDATLAAFEALTGLTVSSPPQASVQGLTSQGVSGIYTAEQALQRLLANTGLSARLSSANTYTLEVRPVSENVEVRAAMPYGPGTSTTATRTLTPLRDIPQSITVITRAMIADQNMQSMADVVRYVPGIGMAQGEGHRDAPVLRGNNTTSDFFVDGVRDDVQYFRDLYNIERVEALKGPNAMIFGRGGIGGVINRSTRQADWSTVREFTLQGGSFDHRRVTLDVAQAVNNSVAVRLTGMYESSGSYRQGVGLERYGFNPTVAFMLPDSTQVRIGYERFHDERTVDRGIPNLGSRPVATDESTFFGDPGLSHAPSTVDALTVAVDHGFGSGVFLRNRSRVADYDKFYQNVYPGASVTAGGTTAPLAAYNNFTDRRNIFSQTDLTYTVRSGRLTHVLLAGMEVGRQATENVRHTGYFTAIGPNATSYAVPVSAPTVSVPVVFRQSATDADNQGVATMGAVFVQDQLEFSPQVQAIVGLRFDRFNLDVHNNRTGADLASRDNLLSPRAGVIVKPVEPVSLYASYSLSYLLRAGEQLSALSLTNQALDPEKFINYEVGAKLDVRPALALTVAAYRLNRTNVAIPDPADASRLLLVDGQRTNGVEVGIAGNVAPSWNILGGYAFQDGKLTRALPGGAAGAALGLVPAHTFSLWNRYDVSPRWGLGAGIVHNADMFTSNDNTVVLPAFTRVDGALFLQLTRALKMQVNVENLLDEEYYPFSHGNSNITPGSPRAARVTLTAAF